jgi:fructokinase
MDNKFLFPMIRNYYTELLSGYIDMPQVKDTDTYIVPAGLEGNQGIIGAMNLF